MRQPACKAHLTCGRYIKLYLPLLYVRWDFASDFVWIWELKLVNLLKLCIFFYLMVCYCFYCLCYLWVKVSSKSFSHFGVIVKLTISSSISSSIFSEVINKKKNITCYGVLWHYNVHMIVLNFIWFDLITGIRTYFFLASRCVVHIAG